MGLILHLYDPIVGAIMDRPVNSPELTPRPDYHYVDKKDQPSKLHVIARAAGPWQSR